MQKKIYIIGHKANEISDAIDYLKEGANGLEPEICYIKNTKEKFYVYEKLPESEIGMQELFQRIMHGEVPSLKNYLHALTDFLTTNPRLRLSVLFIKLSHPYDYDINELYEVIRRNFSNDSHGTAVVTAAAEPGAMQLLSALKTQHRNETVSVSANAAPEMVTEYFGGFGLRYGFGTGTDVPGLSSAADTFTDRARIAAGMKEMDPGGRLKMIHAWTVNSEQSMKTYLDIGVDAIVTNKPGRLKNLVESQLYRYKYILAGISDEPFL